MNHQHRRDIALWRYSVLGPLVSARLAYGDRRKLFLEASRHNYEQPCGRRVRLSARTIEGWYYAYQRDGLRGLEPRRRKDAGRNRGLTPAEDRRPAHVSWFSGNETSRVLV